MAVAVCLVRQELRETVDLMVCQDFQERKGTEEMSETRVLLGNLEKMETRVLLDLPGLLVLPGKLVHGAWLVQEVLLAHQVSQV